MNKMLNGEDLYNEKAQYDFINKLFGIEIKEDSNKSNNNSKSNKNIEYTLAQKTNTSFNSLDNSQQNEHYLQTIQIKGTYDKNGNTKELRENMLASIVGYKNSYTYVALITNREYLKNKLKKDASYDNFRTGIIPSSLNNTASYLNHDIFLIKFKSDKKISSLTELNIVRKDSKNEYIIKTLKDVSINLLFNSEFLFVLENGEYTKIDNLIDLNTWNDSNIKESL